MSGDEAAVFRFLAEDLGCFGGYKAVAGAVETVAANAVLFVVFIRNAIKVSLLGHGLVERGVEHGDLREAREEFGGTFHAGSMGRFMQRGKQRDAADVVDDFLRDTFALDVLTAVHHAVADSFDRIDKLLFTEELLDFGNGFGVSGAIEVEVDVAGRAFCLDVAVNADIFDEAARDGFFGLGVDNGELDRGAAAIKNEYAHFGKQWLVVWFDKLTNLIKVPEPAEGVVSSSSSVCCVVVLSGVRRTESKDLVTYG